MSTNTNSPVIFIVTTICNLPDTRLQRVPLRVWAAFQILGWERVGKHLKEPQEEIFSKLSSLQIVCITDYNLQNTRVKPYKVRVYHSQDSPTSPDSVFGLTLPLPLNTIAYCSSSPFPSAPTSYSTTLAPSIQVFWKGSPRIWKG